MFLFYIIVDMHMPFFRIAWFIMPEGGYYWVLAAFVDINQIDHTVR